MIRDKKEVLRLKRHRRILCRIQGTQSKPRLVLRRSLKHLFVQIIDDTQNKILFSLSTTNPQIKEKFPVAGNIKAAEFFGEALAQKAKEKGINEIVFDRAGYLYHGRIKAFAESLRKAGLKF